MMRRHVDPHDSGIAASDLVRELPDDDPTG
jgi:hypothetical protein